MAGREKAKEGNEEKKEERQDGRKEVRKYRMDDRKKREGRRGGIREGSRMLGKDGKEGGTWRCSNLMGLLSSLYGLT